MPLSAPPPLSWNFLASSSSDRGRGAAAVDLDAGLEFLACAGVTAGGVGEVLVGHAEAAAEPRRGDRVSRSESQSDPPGWDTPAMAITGVHAILYTRDAEADRAWFAGVLGLDSVDAGGGWIIFTLPPAELAAHPASKEGGDVELYLMCDSIEATMGELRDKGVVFDGHVTDQRWGLVTKIVLPSGARLGLYEPRHASPLLPAD